jgi:hypothetical protein
MHRSYPCRFSDSFWTPASAGVTEFESSARGSEALLKNGPNQLALVKILWRLLFTSTHMRRAGAAQSVITTITGHSSDEIFRRYDTIDREAAHNAVDWMRDYQKNLDQNVDQEGLRWTRGVKLYCLTP